MLCIVGLLTGFGRPHHSTRRYKCKHQHHHQHRSRPPAALKRDIQQAAARAAKQPPSHGAYGQGLEDAVALREKLLMFDQVRACVRARVGLGWVGFVWVWD